MIPMNNSCKLLVNGKKTRKTAKKRHSGKNIAHGNGGVSFRSIVHTVGLQSYEQSVATMLRADVSVLYTHGQAIF